MMFSTTGLPKTIPSPCFHQGTSGWAALAAATLAAECGDAWTRAARVAHGLVPATWAWAWARPLGNGPRRPEKAAIGTGRAGTTGRAVTADPGTSVHGA